MDLVDTYLTNGDFWALWRYIAGPDVDEAVFENMDEDELRQFDTLYDIVYMGQNEPVTSSEHAVGLRHGPELRSSIQAWRASVR